MESKTLPDGYLETCSLDALESLMLARKNVAMNFLGETRRLLELWVQAEMDAKLAEWMLDMRRSQALRAGGSAKLLPAKESAGRAQRALIASNAGPTEASAARSPARQPVSPTATPQLNAARMPSRTSHRRVVATPAVGGLRRRQAPAQVSSRALVSSSAAGGKIQPSPNTDCAGTPHGTGGPSFVRNAVHADQHSPRHTTPTTREVLDLLPSNAAISAVQAIAETKTRRRGSDSRSRGATRPLPARVRLVSFSRWRTAG
jgi:hypothetical protein